MMSVSCTINTRADGAGATATRSRGRRSSVHQREHINVIDLDYKSTSL